MKKLIVAFVFTILFTSIPLAGASELLTYAKCDPNSKGVFLVLKPYCGAIGTRSEGWHQKDWNGVERLMEINGGPAYDKCECKTVSCEAIGTRSEGWYIEDKAGCVPYLQQPVYEPLPQLHGEVRTIEFVGGFGVSAYGRYKGKATVEDSNDNDSLYPVDHLSVRTTQDGKLLGKNDCYNCAKVEVETELFEGEINIIEGSPIPLPKFTGDFSDQISGHFEAVLNGVSVTCDRSANASGARNCYSRW